MSANIPIDVPYVKFDLIRYLSDNWVPVIERDVGGPSALLLHIDRDVPNLGKYSATRRFARTSDLGSAPLSAVANRAVDDRRVKLGCGSFAVQPANERAQTQGPQGVRRGKQLCRP